MLDILNSSTLLIGNKSLDALWQRSNVISGNISNNDTPGYKAKQVDFEDELRQAVNSGNLGTTQIESLNPIVKDISGTYGVDGNGDSLEEQLIDLTKNQLQYSYMERAESDNLGLLNTAARQGR